MRVDRIILMQKRKGSQEDITIFLSFVYRTYVQAFSIIPSVQPRKVRVNGRRQADPGNHSYRTQKTSHHLGNPDLHTSLWTILTSLQAITDKVPSILY